MVTFPIDWCNELAVLAATTIPKNCGVFLQGNFRNAALSARGTLALNAESSIEGRGEVTSDTDVVAV